MRSRWPLAGSPVTLINIRCPVLTRGYATNLPLLRHRLVQRVLRIGSTQKCLYTEQYRAYLQSWRPVVLQYVEADAAKAVDVGVVDAGEEAYPRWTHGVVVREKQFQLEDSSCSIETSACTIFSSLPCDWSYPRSNCPQVLPLSRQSTAHCRRVVRLRSQAQAHFEVSRSL